MQMYRSFSTHAAYADNLAKQWFYKESPQIVKYQLCLCKKGLDFLWIDQTWQVIST